MKVIIINKDGKSWTFDSVKKAMPFIKKDKKDNYDIIDGNRVYDDRDEIFGY